MAKKESNLLALGPLGQSETSVVIYGAVANMGRPQSQNEQRIEAETQRQLLIIRSQRMKAETAAHEISQMHQYGAQEFLEVASHLAALKETAQGKEYLQLVEEFNQRSAQLAAQHLFGVTEMSARNIGMETARPLYRENEQPPPTVKIVEKRSLLRRLMGE